MPPHIRFPCDDLLWVQQLTKKVFVAQAILERQHYRSRTDDAAVGLDALFGVECLAENDHELCRFKAFCAGEGLYSRLLFAFRGNEREARCVDRFNMRCATDQGDLVSCKRERPANGAPERPCS